MRRREWRRVGLGDYHDIATCCLACENAGHGVFEDQASRWIDVEAFCAQQVTFRARFAGCDFLAADDDGWHRNTGRRHAPFCKFDRRGGHDRPSVGRNAV